MQEDVCPKSIRRRIRRAGLTESLKIEKVFLRDEIVRSEDRLSLLKKKFTSYYGNVREFLSLCDFIRFSKLLGDMEQKLGVRLKLKYGNFCDYSDKTTAWQVYSGSI